MGVKLDQEGVMRLLDKLYEQATQGIAMVSPPIEETAGDYLRNNPDIDTAAKKVIRLPNVLRQDSWQVSVESLRFLLQFQQM